MNSSLQQLRQAFSQQNWPQVSRLCQQLLRDNPNNAEVHFVLGLMSGHHGKTITAIKAFRRVIDIDPTRLDAHAQLARCLVMRGDHGEAESHATTIANSDTDNAKTVDLAATVFSHLGKQTEALKLYQRCLELAPDSVAFLSNTASCLIFLGRLDEAKRLLKKAIGLEPSSARLHWQLSKIEKAKDTSHICQMQSLLDRFPQDHPNRSLLHYALGKEREDLEDWDKAWQHYDSGAKLHRRRHPYNRNKDIEIFLALENLISSEWLSSNIQSSAVQISQQQAAPIFILGLPRSGTTLVERIISSHSQVQCLGELQQIPIVSKQLSGDTSAEVLSADIVDKLSRSDPIDLANNYLTSISHLRDESPRFTDKLPQNYFYTGLIAAAFPHARFICLRRNPMDSCFSLYKQLFANAYQFSYDLQDLGYYYQHFDQLINHWQALIPDRFMQVHYEDLIDNQEQKTRELLKFCNLPFEPQCLTFEDNDSAAATASASQVREKINNRSIDRWKHYEEQLKPLSIILNP